jgi:hypothetical protein
MSSTVSKREELAVNIASRSGPYKPSAATLEAIAKCIETLTATAALQVGAELAKARDIFRYCRDEGGFAGWVETRLHYSRHTAYNLIHVHEQFGGQKVSKCLDTLGRSVLFLIGTPSTPPEARDAVLDRAQNGESVSVAETKKIIDTAKGRQQPASKGGRGRGPTRKCRQCGQRGKIGEVQQHHYAQYDDAEVWLHDACISAFEDAEQQRKQRLDAAVALMDGKTEPIGSASNDEIERLQAEKRALEIKIEDFETKLLLAPSADDIKNLQAEKYQRDETIAALRCRIKILEHAAATGAPLPPVDDGIPEFLRRLTPIELLDRLEQELRRIGVDDAAADLRRIRKRIEGAHTQIDLAATPVSGSA